MSCFQPIFARESALKLEVTRKILFQATYKRVVPSRYFLRRRLLVPLHSGFGRYWFWPTYAGQDPPLELGVTMIVPPEPIKTSVES